jgi:hypothetical protein
MGLRPIEAACARERRGDRERCLECVAGWGDYAPCNALRDDA